jgi:hypothetical protein
VKTGARWTDEEDQRLLALRAIRKPIPLIAKKLQRTETAVWDRLLILKNRSKQSALSITSESDTLSRNKQRRY